MLVSGKLFVQLVPAEYSFTLDLLAAHFLFTESDLVEQSFGDLREKLGKLTEDGKKFTEEEKTYIQNTYEESDRLAEGYDKRLTDLEEHSHWKDLPVPPSTIEIDDLTKFVKTHDERIRELFSRLKVS